MNYQHQNTDTIVALATPQGQGALGIIRLSGPNAISICDQVFLNKNRKPGNLKEKASHTIHFGVIYVDDYELDEVLVSIFKAPHSYTTQDVVEISCHGSNYIQQQIIQLLVKQGARLAQPGEFTLRAFLNGRLDLSQAEAVADLISSNSSASHQVAMQQMRGGFSNKIKVLRENLVNFASLIELELDFSEEDVEFASRTDLKGLILSIQRIITRLIQSFEVGNVIKNGIPVAIVGKPNAGKSTLLNALLDDERAIVSDIPGTTRDTIEDELTIDGILFRFIDTAGIRDTNDVIESIGVSKTFEKIRQSSIVIYLFDIHEITSKELGQILDEVKAHINGSQLLVVGNKIDKEDLEYTKREFSGYPDTMFISSKTGYNIDGLKAKLVELFDNKTVNVPETIVTNARHVEALMQANKYLVQVLEGLNNKTTPDLLAEDIKMCLYYLGMITGEVSSDELLANIFSKFCIGK